MVDRFHVTRLYQQAADDLRQKELHRLKRDLPKEEYQLLKGNLWALRKQTEDPRLEERQVLSRLWKRAPQLKQAYDSRQMSPKNYETLDPN